MFNGDHESSAEIAQSVLLKASSTLLHTMSSSIPTWKSRFLQQMQDHYSFTTSSTNSTASQKENREQEMWELETKIRSVILKIENLVVQNMKLTSPPKSKDSYSTTFLSHGFLNFDQELNEIYIVERNVNEHCKYLQQQVQKLEIIKPPTNNNDIIPTKNENHWKILQILGQISDSYYNLSLMVKSIIDDPDAHLSYGQISNDLLSDIDQLHIEQENSPKTPSTPKTSPTTTINKPPIATVKESQEPLSTSPITSPSNRCHFEFPSSSLQQQQQEQLQQQENQNYEKFQHQPENELQIKHQEIAQNQPQTFSSNESKDQQQKQQQKQQQQKQQQQKQQQYVHHPYPRQNKRSRITKPHKLRTNTTSSPTTTSPSPIIGRHNPFTTTEDSVPYFVGAYNTQLSTSNSPSSVPASSSTHLPHGNFDTEPVEEELEEEEDKHLHVVGSIKRKHKKRSYDGMVTRFKLVPSSKQDDDEEINRSRSA